MKMIIRNLDRQTTEQALQAAFAAHGKVQSCVIVKDAATGLSKGFGFVEMPKPGDAKAAVKTLNESTLGDSKIRVKYAEEKANKD